MFLFKILHSRTIAIASHTFNNQNDVNLESIILLMKIMIHPQNKQITNVIERVINI